MNEDFDRTIVSNASHTSLLLLLHALAGNVKTSMILATVVEGTLI